MKTASSIVLFVFLVTMASAADYQITKKIPIPGQGSWDYLAVDEAARRLYVSHGTQVEVLDVDSGTVVGNIANTPGVHGIANRARTRPRVREQWPILNGHDF